MQRQFKVSSGTRLWTGGALALFEAPENDIAKAIEVRGESERNWLMLGMLQALQKS
jgi:hypothetical protein